MRFAVVTLGSAGDLHPFLAIARALAERGHEVHLLTQAPYEASVRAEGVGFIPIASRKDHDRTLKHPLLWHPLHGFGVLWRHLAVPAIGPTIEALDTLSRDQASSGPLVVFASPLAAGARLARECWPARIRLASGYTAPMGLRSTDDPMFLGAWQVPQWLPRRARHALWTGLDRWKLEPMARPVLARWRQHLGLPPAHGSSFGDTLHSPDGGLALYPSWFAPVPPSWRARRVHQVGFPIFEPSGESPPAGALAEFLSDPSPYLVAYPGSADRRAKEFSSWVTAAGRAAGLRTLVLSRLDGQEDAPSFMGNLRMDAAPLGEVLPGARAFVHHGGIGSLAQGFLARVPQLVLASAYDQFENGERLARLGAGHWLPRSSATQARLQSHIQALVSQGAKGDDEYPDTASRSGAANFSANEGADFLQQMQQQLALPGLAPETDRFPTDTVQRTGRTLRGYTLFLALVPPIEALPALESVGDELITKHGVTGSRTAAQRLHVTLHELAQFPAAPDVPAAAIAAAIAACDRVGPSSTALTFDRVAGFPRADVFVMLCDAESQKRAALLRNTVAAELRRVGLRPRASSQPYMTLVYGIRQPVGEHSIAPVRCSGMRLVMLLSHVGLTHHQLIREWSMSSK